MYVNVTQSASEVMKLRQQVAEGNYWRQTARLQWISNLTTVRFTLKKAVCCLQIRLSTKTTGQITLRAAIPNDRIS